MAAGAAAAGHDSKEVRPVRLPDGFFPEVPRVVRSRRVRNEVSPRRRSRSLPVVLSGNCGYAALAPCCLGAGPRLWLTARDSTLPETVAVGFFDANRPRHAPAGLRVVAVARSFAGFTGREERVVLLGARDRDEEERAARRPRR